jgi:riboflavin biosynthesis pyrimidine reductase/pyrimidine deaminase RibD-like protein
VAQPPAARYTLPPMRPYVLLSCALSADGYLDDASPDRLILSGPADLDRVDEMRACCDAILVGGNTVRRDNPRLLIRSSTRRAARLARGLSEQPLRVVLTASGTLDPGANCFTHASPYLVYRDRSLGELLDDLGNRAVHRLLVEGGATVLGQFLAQDLANELQLAIAPFFVADPAAPRLNLPVGRPARMTLAQVSRSGDMTVASYLLGPGGADERYLRLAIELSRQCPPSGTAFSVGAVIVGEDGELLATGYSREQAGRDHAEEVALRKAGHDPRLRHATLYSSLVPCAARASRLVTCVQHIVQAGIPRVVYAWNEPPTFVPGASTNPAAQELRAAGAAVVQLPDLADAAAAVNTHLRLASALALPAKSALVLRDSRLPHARNLSWSAFALQHNEWDHALKVAADGIGLAGHAGAVLLGKAADQTGLTAQLSAALSSKGSSPVFVRGAVLVSLAPRSRSGRPA